MNEQIQKLIARADYEAPGGKWKEYFAELIVRECAHLVGGYTKENEFGTDTDVKEAYEEITKHFGVEE